MILPIGHEEGGLRRLPWVTFGLMILCVLAFLATGRGASPEEGTRDPSSRKLSRYFLDHPYLDLDRGFEEYVFPGMGEKQRSELLEALHAGAHPPQDPATTRAQQAELDLLARSVSKVVAEEPFNRWGLVPGRISLLVLLTHMFMHVGWLHILGNLFMLYLAGPYIEDVWGRLLFTVFYLTAGIVAALAFVVREPQLGVPLVGASGAIAGVMGAFLIRYWRTRIRFFYFLGFRLHGTFDAPAWLMLPLWFAQQIFMAAMSDSGTGGGVAYLAHVAGFTFGAGVAWVMGQLQIETRYVHPRIESKVSTTHVDKPVLHQAMELSSQGNAQGAFDILIAESRRSPNDCDVALALWDVALELGCATEAAPAMERAIRIELRSADPHLAPDHWRELREHAPRVHLEPPILVRLAQVMVQSGETPEAVRTLRSAMLSGGPDIEPGLALRVAQLSKDMDPELAQSAVRLALSRPGVDPAERAQAERLLADLQSPRNVIPVIPV